MNNQKPAVYLAGGMKSGWQDKVKVRLAGWAYCIDPRDNGSDIAEEFTLWDCVGINNCDFVFAFLEKENPGELGLAFELGYAYAQGKTIIFVNDTDGSRTSMLEAVADVEFWNLSTALEYMDNLGLQYINRWRYGDIKG